LYTHARHCGSSSGFIFTSTRARVPCPLRAHTHACAHCASAQTSSRNTLPHAPHAHCTTRAALTACRRTDRAASIRQLGLFQAVPVSRRRPTLAWTPKQFHHGLPRPHHARRTDLPLTAALAFCLHHCPCWILVGGISFGLPPAAFPATAGLHYPCVVYAGTSCCGLATLMRRHYFRSRSLCVKYLEGGIVIMLILMGTPDIVGLFAAGHSIAVALRALRHDTLRDDVATTFSWTDTQCLGLFSFWTFHLRAPFGRGTFFPLLFDTNSTSFLLACLMRRAGWRGHCTDCADAALARRRLPSFRHLRLLTLFSAHLST